MTTLEDLEEVPAQDSPAVTGQPATTTEPAEDQ